MDGHDIRAWPDSGFTRSKSTKEYFDEFSSNKFGKIMSTADANTLNCMKFAHYLPEYQRLFSEVGDKEINLLEIGVQHGGSYRLWKNYFGEDLLSWTGIDIDQRCMALNHQLVSSKGLVCCGHQADPVFLENIASQRGQFDIVIDDGSHQSEHIVSAFKTLSKHVKDGGLYIVEDIHACYWEDFRGEFDSSNALSYFLTLAHSLNVQATRHARCSKNLSADELVVPPASIQKIELLPSMIVCHMGTPPPMIEWKAGKNSVIALD